MRWQLTRTVSNADRPLFQAPDLPDIPTGDEIKGKNYLAFLAILKNLMGPARLVSIAAPALYWYLKGFPIKEITKVVDYIIYMIYDLYSQVRPSSLYLVVPRNSSD